MKKLVLMSISVFLLSGCSSSSNDDVEPTDYSTYRAVIEETEESWATMNSKDIVEQDSQGGNEEKNRIKRNISEYQLYVPNGYKNEPALMNIVEIQQEQLVKNNTEISSAENDVVNFGFMGGYADTQYNKIDLFYFLFNNSDKEIKEITFSHGMSMNKWGINESMSNDFSFKGNGFCIVPPNSVTPLFLPIYPKSTLDKEVKNFISAEDFNELDIQNIIVHYTKGDK